MRSSMYILSPLEKWTGFLGLWNTLLNKLASKIIGEIFKMEDCEEKRRRIEEAKSLRPRFYQDCLNDHLFCGW